MQAGAAGAARDKVENVAIVPWFTEATIRGARVLPAPPDAPKPTPGTHGSGIRPATALPLEGVALKRDTGLISLWIRPGWSGDDGKRHIFLRVGDPTRNGLLLEKSERNFLRFVMSSPAGSTAARADVGAWRADEWHHVAIAWSSREGKPVALTLWIDRTAVAGTTVGRNTFLDVAALADPRLYVGDLSSEADIDELIVRHDFNAEGFGQLGIVYRDYFRTAPYDRIRIEPDASLVPSDRRAVAGFAKQFGLRAGAGLEPVTDFTVRYNCWGDFDAKPFIRWSVSDPAVATVDGKGLVTGVAPGRCTLTAEFRGMTDTYPLEVTPIEQPDLDLVSVSRLPRYSSKREKWGPAVGEQVESVARVVNMGFAEAPAGTEVRFELVPDTNRNFVLDPDEKPVTSVTKTIKQPLPPQAEAEVRFPWAWPVGPVWIRVTVDPGNRVAEFCKANNEVADLNIARPVKFGYAPEFVQACYKNRKINLVGSFSYFDYINANKLRTDRMLREAVYPETTPFGVADAFRTDLMYPLPPQGQPEPPEAAGEFYDGGFPVGSHAQLMATDAGLIHEFGHTMLQLADIKYGVRASNVFLADENGKPYAGTELLPIIGGDFLPVGSSTDVPNGVGYTHLMTYCHLWLHPADAGHVQHFRGHRGARFWGTQGWLIPSLENVIKVTDIDDKPLAGAAVSVYHATQASGAEDAEEKFFADRPKFAGVTDEDGRFFLPKQTDRAWDDADTDVVEGVFPAWNPFRRVNAEVAFTSNVWAVQGILLLKIASGSEVEFAWLRLEEFNQAFFRGEVRGQYPIRTSLRPSAVPTPVARPTIPAAISVKNLRPIAVCKTDITVRCGEEYTLDGSESHDPEGQPLAYRWKRRSWGVPGPSRGTEPTFTGKAPEQPGDVLLSFYVIDGVRISEVVKVTVHAVAPVGLKVDFARKRVLADSQPTRIPVVVSNSLDRPWSGPVTLRVKNGDRLHAELKEESSVEPLGQAVVNFEVKWPDPVGPCSLEAELTGVDGKPVRNRYDTEIVGPRTVGFAFQKSATASSVQQEAHAPANAVDGDPATYWSSTFADPAWLAVDLGAARMISRVGITWETAFSKSFSVQVSVDGQAWTDVFEEENGKGGRSEITFAPVKARHVRISGTSRGTQWGHAIRELQVFD